MGDATEPPCCPHCGVAMNRHGEKLLLASDPVETAQADPALGGVVEETFACPRCGRAASRHA